MRGPIDFIIVGFEGNKFDGSVLKALKAPLDNGVIGLIDLGLVTKDKKGVVTTINVAEVGDDFAVEFSQKYPAKAGSLTSDDIDEMSELLENDTSAGILVIEHLWAKPLKKALLDANGVLVAEGRIHPEAVEELK